MIGVLEMLLIVAIGGGGLIGLVAIVMFVYHQSTGNGHATDEVRLRLDDIEDRLDEIEAQLSSDSTSDVSPTPPEPMETASPAT